MSIQKTILSTVIISILLVSQAKPAQAVCLGPDPLCVAIVVATVGKLAEGVTGKEEVCAVSISQDLGELEAIDKQLDGIRDFKIQMSKYASYNPGYGSIQSCFAKGEIKGRLSLESQWEFSTKVFNHLDQLEAVLIDTLGAERVISYYGPTHTGASTGESLESINWERYAKLAADAENLYANSFVNWNKVAAVSVE